MTIMTARQAADSQRRGVFEIDEDAALAELKLAWDSAGYHGFSADGDTWSAISDDGTVFTGATVDELNRKIRAHWAEMQ